MGERAQNVVIQGGRVQRCRSQWGRQSCPRVLLDRRSGLEADLNERKPPGGQMDGSGLRRGRLSGGFRSQNGSSLVLG